MTQCEFRKLIKQDIFEFSNKEWQYKTWTVFNPKSFYDPVEQIIDFLDGRFIEKYVYQVDNCLEYEEQEGLKNFLHVLNRYVNKNKNEKGELILDPQKTFYSPEWEEIRLEAKKLYFLMNNYDNN